MQIQAPDGPRRALVCSDLDLLTRYDLNTIATTAPEGVKFTIVADASNASELLPHPPVNGADTKVCPATPPRPDRSIPPATFSVDCPTCGQMMAIQQLRTVPQRAATPPTTAAPLPASACCHAASVLRGVHAAAAAAVVSAVRRRPWRARLHAWPPHCRRARV